MSTEDLHSRLRLESDAVGGSVPPPSSHLTALAARRRHRRRLAVVGGLAGAVAIVAGGAWFVADDSERDGAEQAADPSASHDAAPDGTLACSSDSRQARGLAPFEGLIYFADLESVSRYYFGGTERPVVEVDPEHVIITDTETAPQVRLLVEHDDEGWGVTTMEACAGAMLPPLGGVGQP